MCGNLRVSDFCSDKIELFVVGPQSLDLVHAFIVDIVYLVRLE